MNRKIRKIWINFESLKGFEQTHLRYAVIALLLFVFIAGVAAIEEATNKKVAYIEDIIAGFAPVFADTVQDSRFFLQKDGSFDTPQNELLKQKMDEWKKYHSHVSNVYCVRKNSRNGIIILCANGNVSNTLEIEGELNRNAADYSRAFEGKITYEQRLFQHNWGEAISLYVPVFSKSGIVQGILVVDFNSSMLKKEIADMRMLIIAVLMIAVLLLYIGYWKMYMSKIENEIVKISHRKLEEFATKDSLTRTYNRYKFEELFKIEIERAMRYKHPLSLIMFDVDNFKKVNDTYGHQAGDSILKHVTTVVKTIIRNNDIFARWGGDEFLVAFPETKVDDVYKIAEKIRSAVYEHDFGFGKHFSISIGIAGYRYNDEYEAFMKKADEALYRSKESRNTTSIAE